MAFLFDGSSTRDVDAREAMAVTATGPAREITDAAARAAAAYCRIRTVDQAL